MRGKEGRKKGGREEGREGRREGERERGKEDVGHKLRRNQNNSKAKQTIENTKDVQVPSHVVLLLLLLLL